MQKRVRRPRRELTKVTITERYRRFSDGQLQNWAAKSEDGVWDYNRSEESGTPWIVTHVPTKLEAGWYSSLPNARAATADGRALRDVERQQAHERGEHKEKRNPMCVKCL